MKDASVAPILKAKCGCSYAHLRRNKLIMVLTHPRCPMYDNQGHQLMKLVQSCQGISTFFLQYVLWLIFICIHYSQTRLVHFEDAELFSLGQLLLYGSLPEPLIQNLHETFSNTIMGVYRKPIGAQNTCCVDEIYSSLGML